MFARLCGWDASRGIWRVALLGPVSQSESAQYFWKELVPEVQPSKFPDLHPIRTNERLALAFKKDRAESIGYRRRHRQSLPFICCPDVCKYGSQRLSISALHAIYDAQSLATIFADVRAAYEGKALSMPAPVTIILVLSPASTSMLHGGWWRFSKACFS
jgi:hypothetical protein